MHHTLTSAQATAATQHLQHILITCNKPSTPATHYTLASAQDNALQHNHNTCIIPTTHLAPSPPPTADTTHPRICANDCCTLLVDDWPKAATNWGKMLMAQP